MNRKSSYCLVAAMLLLCSSGCVHEHVDGTTHTFTYEMWVPITVMLLGIASVPAGWLLSKLASRFGLILLILGPVAALFFAPSLFRDRAVIDDTGLSLRTGIWGLTEVHEVKFDDLQQVRIVSETVRSRRRKRTNYYLLCERKNGTSAKVPVSNNVMESAALNFVERVSIKNIPIIDETE